MASRKKDTLSKRAGHSMESGKVEKFYRTRARARKLAAEAKDLTEGAAGDKKGKSPAGPSCPVDSNCDATIPASRNENDKQFSAKNDGERKNTSHRNGVKKFKRRNEILRRRIKALEGVVSAQGKTIEMQTKDLETIKETEKQLRKWREQTHEALNFLLWERTGAHQGAYRSETLGGLWGELEDYHKYY